MSDWQPTISLGNLRARAHVLAQIRNFFANNHVLEVETPLACSYTVTEPNTDSFIISGQSAKRFLQTSPEYAMKRLLAAGAPDIYQICKAFRQGELGKHHSPEFTIIEWYRLGFNLEQIMQETVALIVEVMGDAQCDNAINYLSYDEFFKLSLGASFSTLSKKDIKQIATDYGLQISGSISFGQMTDFIFSRLASGFMQKNSITCIYHYPASQAALAKLKDNNQSVAERFEVFFRDVELANGYVELTDADLQLSRFKQDQDIRQKHGLADIEIDQRLLDAQKHGLPECAGVALGFDRLLMLALGANHLNQVISFDWNNS